MIVCIFRNCQGKVQNNTEIYLSEIFTSKWPIRKSIFNFILEIRVLGCVRLISIFLQNSFIYHTLVPEVLDASNHRQFCC